MTTHDQLRDRAVEVLRSNDRGDMTVAAAQLYPHMWSWDSAFIAMGWAHVSIPRAITEMRTLLAAQWSTGMIPHIVFSNVDGYFPGPQRWGTDKAPAAPRQPATSGICQPPVHALAVDYILQQARRSGGTDLRLAEEFAHDLFMPLMRWHRWLATERDPEHVGLVEIYHGWESGMDNSARWDSAYANVVPGDELPAFTRVDTAKVSDAKQRPDDDEYRRYLWLVEQLRSVNYVDAAAREIIDFRVRDVFSSAILALSCQSLSRIGREFGYSALAQELEELTARFRNGVALSVSPQTGLATDFDVRTEHSIDSQTIAGFAPLLCGLDATHVMQRQRELFWGQGWCGHPELAFALPPSQPPDTSGFSPRTYWRGPVWPVMNWLFGLAFEQQGCHSDAAQLREASLSQLSDGKFGEYYEPLSSEALGSTEQSWTAAATLCWLAHDQRNA